MEIRVSNISSHVPSSTLRLLFDHFGDILFFEHFASLSKRDGSFECSVIFSELSAAQLALRMSGTELGDRCIEVRLETGMKRFLGDFVASEQQPQSRTLLIRKEDLDSLNGVFRSLPLERSCSTEKRHFWLAEFESIAAASEALKSGDAVEARAALQLPAQTEQASANRTPMEEVMIYGVPASKLLEPRPAPKKETSTASQVRSRSRSPEGRSHYRRDGRDRRYDDDRDRDRYCSRSGRESGREFGRERDHGRDRERESGRDCGRDNGRDRERDRERDSGRDEYRRR